MSIGLTRIFAKMMKEGRILLGPKGPTEVFVVRLPWTPPDRVAATAKILRGRGLNVETHYEVGKLDAQLRYASRKGIPYVWFTAGEAGKPDEVKDLRTGQHVEADSANWEPMR